MPDSKVVPPPPPVPAGQRSAPAADPVPPATVEAADTAQWYKDAIIYQLHVKAFFDADDDGTGDFRGLSERLDYIQNLGVNTIWLLPFYPSPLRDDGYDVANYVDVNRLYGTRADVRQFVREAHRRNLRVITELIVNHTSDQHPWFQAARRAPKGSNKRNYYVWSDDPTKYAGTRIIFTDTEKSNWAWDEVAQAYYWHRFFSHQPDLNFDNPQVMKAIFRVMRFWLDVGVDGFRLDAIPYLVEREGTNNENLPETHAVLKKLRALIDAHYPNVLLLAEANQWPEDVREYFGDGDECHMAYHFPLMPRMYMAVAQEERHPITEIMAQTPEIPDACQWAIFLRNHDELTLEMVTNKERDYMYSMYAADRRARINVGIRRRLAPLLDNDMARIKLMNSLLLSMPGSPILYYGDEIGMGDNIYLGDRDGVRTPMQWRPERNAGFSRADPQRLYLPPIMDPIFGYEAINVEAQERAPTSLLRWTRRMLTVRKEFAAFGRGSLTFLRPANRKILAYLREYRGETVLCVANLGRTAQPVELDLAAHKGRVPVELMGRTTFPSIGELPYLLTLEGYGFLWFRLAPAAEDTARAEGVRARDDLPVLVLFDAWASLFRERVVPWRIRLSEKVRRQFETEVLPPFLAERRWYASKGEAVRTTEIADHVEWKGGARDWLLTIVRVESASGKARAYFLPLVLAWEDSDEALVRNLGTFTLAKARQQAQVGIVADAFGDEAFVRALVAAVGDGQELKAARGTLRFRPTAAFGRLAGAGVGTLPVAAPSAKQHEHGGHARRAPDRQGLSPAPAGHEPRSGDRSLPDRRRRVPPLRARCRQRRVPRGRRPHRGARRAAGLRAEPGQRLGLHDGVPRSLLRGRAAGPRRDGCPGRPRRLPWPDAAARHAHGRAARGVRAADGRPRLRAGAADLRRHRGGGGARAQGSRRRARPPRAAPRRAAGGRARRSRCAARRPRRAAGTHRRARGRRSCRREDAPARRLSPRPGAGRGERLRHRRFRGRALPHHGRAGAEAVPAQGRRRHAALVRLCAARGAVRGGREAPRGARAAGGARARNGWRRRSRRSATATMRWRAPKAWARSAAPVAAPSSSS